MKFTYALMAGALACGLAVSPVSAQDDKGVKDDLKTAGKATGRAAKKTGKKVKKGTEKGAKKVADVTEKGVHKAADATAKGATKVKDKTDDKK